MIRSICRIAALVALSISAGLAASAQDARPSLPEIVEAWLDSPHADRMSEPFTHWNEDGEIPGSCAVCHSSTGVIDYLEGPMTTVGAIDHPVGLGTTVDCTSCHNAAASTLSMVPFPSGAMIETTDSSAICAVCHQGRASTISVNARTEGLDEDTVSGDLGFINVHYAPSAATQLGSEARGGFEYQDKSYKGRFAHVPAASSCTDCHSPHSLEVSFDACTACHQNAGSFAEIRNSPADFDGDGDTSEGIADPIRTLHAHLGEAIRAYAADVAGTPVVYASGSYPYFFIDGDADGTASEAEAAFPNRYQSWTPRLVKAAYNYQLVAKESAIYAHNPHYALQLLYDSLESLSEAVEVDMAGLTRP